MNKIVTVLLFLISTAVFAERIDGPANVRKYIKGEAMFVLNDNVSVDIGVLKNGWYEIVISLTLAKSQYEEGVIKKGQKLINGNDEEIGIALKDINLDSKQSGGGAPGVPDWYGADIYGFTYKGNIKPESIVEPAITQLIESNRHNLTRHIFKEHMNYFGYVDGLKVKDMAQYQTYMISESIFDDISPLDRIRLIFEDDKLVAVVHSRDLILTNFETVLVERGRKLTLIKSFSARDKAAFIEKNKQTYMGID